VPRAKAGSGGGFLSGVRDGMATWLGGALCIALLAVVMMWFDMQSVKKDVDDLKALKLDLMQRDMRQVKSLVRQIALKNGITLPDE